MNVLCPICNQLVPAEQLVHEAAGPPSCASCAAFELVRCGPRRASQSDDGSFLLGFVLGLIFCVSLVGLFFPSVGRDTRKGIAAGFLAQLIVSCVFNVYRVKHGLPLY